MPKGLQSTLREADRSHAAAETSNSLASERELKPRQLKERGSSEMCLKGVLASQSNRHTIEGGKKSKELLNQLALELVVAPVYQGDTAEGSKSRNLVATARSTPTIWRFGPGLPEAHFCHSSNWAVRFQSPRLLRFVRSDLSECCVQGSCKPSAIVLRWIAPMLRHPEYR